MSMISKHRSKHQKSLADVSLCSLSQVRSVCGSRSISASACGSVVQVRALRSQHSPENAARERSRVRNLRQAFHSLQVRSVMKFTPNKSCFTSAFFLFSFVCINATKASNKTRPASLCAFHLQAALPSVPRDTKLSKLDVLVLATNYIAYLTETLDQGGGAAEQTLPSRPGGYLHPVKVRSWSPPMTILVVMTGGWKSGGAIPVNAITSLNGEHNSCLMI